MKPIGASWRRWLQRPLQVPAPAASGDVLVVLGAALAPSGSLGRALEKRVQAAVRAFHAGAAPWLLVTGAREARAMRARAVELGVAAEAVLIEGTARTTRENALASAALMRRHGLRRALIVTQPYHLRRSVLAFRAVGVEAEGVHIHEGPDPLRQVVREYVAFAYYRARGWI